LTDSPTSPPQEVIETQTTFPFSNRSHSLTVSSENFNHFDYSTPDRIIQGNTNEDDSGSFVIQRRPHPRTASSLSTTDALSTDASSLYHPDDEKSLNISSVASDRKSPTTPTVGGRQRSGSLGISSNYALREKLRSHMSKHMKTAQSS
jgi:hypothetical protein